MTTDLFSSRAAMVLRTVRLATFAIVLLSALLGLNLWAGTGGTLLGTVTDPHGAVIVGAKVAAADPATGVKQSVITDGKGFYSFQNLAVGTYDVQVEAPGFKPLRRTGVVVDVNSKIVVDAALTIGNTAETVTVSESNAHVDTVDTQIGEVITEKQMTSVPLNGRAYTDLLALQTGVAPLTSITSTTVQDVGVAAFSPSGNLNPGTMSVNGQRESANSFVLNGSDVEEAVNGGTAVIPNLDSISEFRILTSNFDAEYGEFSGGQISVVTKSGTNAFHGDIFEFVRNTALDARDYFSPTRGAFDQNQFGGTIGGPIKKNKLFFFADYQGTQLTQGVSTGQIAVPSALNRTGNFSDTTSSFVTADQNGNPVPTTVSGPGFASLLSQKLGYAVSAGEPYYTPGCVSSTQCVLPNATIPTSAWSAPATNLLKYIPAPNNANGTFATSAFNQTLGDNKGAFRFDAVTKWGLFSAYYFTDDWSQDSPYPLAQGGANVPGFNALNAGRAQLIALGDTKTFGTNAVNEFRFSYSRDSTTLGKPVGGVGVSLESQGFVTGPNTPGIVALSPKTVGVEAINFNNFSIGTNTNTLEQVNNTYQVRDSFSKVFGTHTVKFGGEWHYYQVNTHAIAQFNGNFVFFGSETGSDFADFLLGAPSQYNQSQLQPFYGRNNFFGLFAQDSWRARRNLTLNYGLRWDRLEPWYEKYNQIATFIPGRQSVVFPGAPEGILFPTDPGVPRTLAPPGNKDFAPRIGLAYAPDPTEGSLPGKILGHSGESSIRASFGVFYTAIEAATIGVSSGNAPYGSTYSSPAPPLFSTPFVTASTGENLGQAFPLQLSSYGATASNPNNNVNWAQFLPISGMPNTQTTNRIPYAEEYMLSFQRGFGNNAVLTVGYVGSQAHHLLVLEESNPGDPALCLQLSNPANLAPGQIPCGPFLESNVFVTASGQTINGTRGPQGPNFGSNAYMATIGNSNYNSLQTTFKYTGSLLQLLAAYTYGKSIDQSSDLGEAVNPFDPGWSRAISSFDVRHNFVMSYTFKFPFAKWFNASNRWTNGWQLSGITRFSTGFPVTLVNNGDNSLIGASPNGVNNAGIDEPDVLPGSLNLNHNPQNGNEYFNSSIFTDNALGTPGTAKRRYFYGPGMANYNMALVKNTRITERTSLQIRLEAFNVFNHTQFFGPEAVDGTLGSSTFGSVVSAQPPRLVQLGAKFTF